jgi:predicted ATP-grasp superfamily ATP-dependent carboligase
MPDRADRVSAASPRVLLVTVAGWTGVARLPRVLHEAGARVTLLSHRDDLVAHTRYVDERLHVTTESLVRSLRRLLDHRGDEFRWVILGDQVVLTTLVAVRSEAWLNGWFPVDPQRDRPLLLISKAAFVTEMTKLGMPIPTSEVVTGEATLRSAVHRIGYPVIIKAVTGTGGVGHRKFASPADLDAFCGRLAPGAEFVVQRFIDGRVGSTVVLYDRARPACWMASYKARVWPAPFGPSCVREPADVPGMGDVTARLGTAIGMHGVCGFDWIQPDGRGPALVVEFNGRPTAWIHMHRAFGADFPGSIRAMLAGEAPSPRPPAPIRPGAPSIRMFPQDLRRAMAQGDWTLIARWCTGLAGQNDMPWDDLPLLRAYLRALIRRITGWLRGTSLRCAGPREDDRTPDRTDHRDGRR